MSQSLFLCFSLFLSTQAFAQQAFLSPQTSALQVTPITLEAISSSPTLIDEDDFRLTRENGIYVVSETNIDEFFEKYDEVVLILYQASCHYFNEFLPDLELIANDLQMRGIFLAKSNVSDNRSLVSLFGVKYSPTILGIKQGTVISEFVDEKTAVNFVSWAQNLYEVTNLLKILKN